MVEDVHLTEEKPDGNKPAGAKLDLFRRLVFKRNSNLIQSEALLVKRAKGGTGEPSAKHGTGKKKNKPPKEVVSTPTTGES